MTFCQCLFCLLLFLLLVSVFGRTDESFLSIFHRLFSRALVTCTGRVSLDTQENVYVEDVRLI